MQGIQHVTRVTATEQENVSVLLRCQIFGQVDGRRVSGRMKDEVGRPLERVCHR